MDPIESDTDPIGVPEGTEDLDEEGQFAVLAEEALGIGFFLDIVMEAIQENDG